MDLSPAVRDELRSFVTALPVQGKRILLVVPDTTRTAPVAALCRVVRDSLRQAGCRQLDVLVALGTHMPLPGPRLRDHIGLDEVGPESGGLAVRLHNHAWDDPSALATVGTIPREEIRSLSDGHMDEAVPVTVNQLVLDADLVIALGPVFPHEIAGFSGGAKYFFPGVSGPDMIDVTHWTGARISNRRIIGTSENPVRAMLHRALAMIPVRTAGISFVVDRDGIAGLFGGSVVEAWRDAVKLSSERHVKRVGRTYKRVLAIAPPMYDDLWTGAKCMYKCESVVADGGELIIHAPGISEFSYTHREALRRVGYHVRDYYLHNWERFAGESRTVLTHSVLAKGEGSFDGTAETPRITVTLATSIPEADCGAVNLGYTDPNRLSADIDSLRTDPDTLVVDHAGETLYLPG